MQNITMKKVRILVLVGSLLLIIGGFYPWISVPNLFGLSGSYYEGIEAGWEGDGVLTTTVGLLLILGELLLGEGARRWHTLTGGILTTLAIFIVLLDFRRILEIAPEAGFFAATDIGIYVTLGGALIALLGYVWKRVPAWMLQ